MHNVNPVSINRNNIYALATEIYKFAYGRFPEIMNKVFKKDKSHHNLRHTSQFSVNSVHSVYNGTESSSYFGPKIWEQIPCYIQNRKFFVGLKWEIKKWKPADCTIVSLIIQIPNCPYSPPWKNSSCFFNFKPFRRPKTQSFRIPEQPPNFQLSRVMHTIWGCVVDVVLSNIKKDRWEKFQSV